MFGRTGHRLHIGRGIEGGRPGAGGAARRGRTQPRQIVGHMENLTHGGVDALKDALHVGAESGDKGVDLRLALDGAVVFLGLVLGQVLAFAVLGAEDFQRAGHAADFVAIVDIGDGDRLVTARDLADDLFQALQWLHQQTRHHHGGDGQRYHQDDGDNQELGHHGVRRFLNHRRLDAREQDARHLARVAEDRLVDRIIGMAHDVGLAEIGLAGLDRGKGLAVLAQLGPDGAAAVRLDQRGRDADEVVLGGVIGEDRGVLAGDARDLVDQGIVGKGRDRVHDDFLDVTTLCPIDADIGELPMDDGRGDAQGRILVFQGVAGGRPLHLQGDDADQAGRGQGHDADHEKPDKTRQFDVTEQLLHGEDTLYIYANTRCF